MPYPTYPIYELKNIRQVTETEQLEYNVRELAGRCDAAEWQVHCEWMLMHRDDLAALNVYVQHELEALDARDDSQMYAELRSA